MKWIKLLLIVGVFDVLIGIAAVLFGHFPYAKGGVTVTTGLGLIYISLSQLRGTVTSKIVLLSLVAINVILFLIWMGV